MGCFDRRKRQVKIELPARLKQLDKEIMYDRTKSFDYVTAVGNGLRVRVCVMRDEDHKYYATAQIGKRAFRHLGGCPSAAYLMLSVAMRVHIAHLTQAERQELIKQSMVSV